LPPPKRTSVSEQDAAVLAEGVIAGNRRVLAQAITLIESKRSDHRAAAADLLERLMPFAGNSIRLGISGVPGVGKSTFIEALGNHVIDAGHRVAVLTVDPSSAISGGSILGDKTRMEQLSRRDEAYIRPSPAGTTLGGVTRRSREAMILCEAAGFDVIIVETVGVGQSETRVADMTDMFVLMLLPGAGDELQGIKRGILELADMIAVNKADGDNLDRATRAASDYANAMHLITPVGATWVPPVVTCSALKKTGLDTLWAAIAEHRDRLAASGELSAKRKGQMLRWMWTLVEDRLISALRADASLAPIIASLEAEILEGSLTPSIAADRVLAAFERRKAAN
jgi:LAO/AO transport system kinase